MTQVTFKGNSVSLKGNLIAKGESLSDIALVGADLSKCTLPNAPVLLCLFPSIDTGVCATQTREFNKRVSEAGIEIWTVSLDLPFALGRFCAAEGIEGVKTLSDFRNQSLAHTGVQMADGPLAGLYARATLLVDAKGMVRYVELVSEVTDEPDYEATMAAIRNLN